jgi:hypothetical protein
LGSVAGAGAGWEADVATAAVTVVDAGVSEAGGDGGSERMLSLASGAAAATGASAVVAGAEATGAGVGAVAAGAEAAGFAAPREEASARALFFGSAVAVADVGGFDATRDGSRRSDFFDSGPLAAAADFAAVAADGSARDAGRESCTILAGTGSSAGPRFFATVGSTNQWKTMAQKTYTPRQPPITAKTGERRDRDVLKRNLPRTCTPIAVFS